MFCILFNFQPRSRGDFVDASNAIKYLRKRLKQDLSREVSRGHSTMAVANAIGRTEL